MKRAPLSVMVRVIRYYKMSRNYCGFAERAGRIARCTASVAGGSHLIKLGPAQGAFAALTLFVAIPGGYTASAANAAAAPAATTSPTSSPSPSPTPFIPVEIDHANHIVYILATDVRPDYDATRDKVLAGFAEIMQNRQLKNTWQLIPMPEWTLDNFVYACNHVNDPNHTIEGALILRIFGVSYWITHKTFQEAPTTAIDADAIYAKCQPQDKQKPVVYKWHDAVEYKDGTIGITNLTNLAWLLPFAALYQSFVPGKSQMTVTTQTFPRPSPLPSNSVVTTVGNSYNPQATGNNALVSTSLLTAGLTYTQSVLNTPPPINDRATWNAVIKLSAQIAADTLCPASANAPASTPQDKAMAQASAAPFCAPSSAASLSPSPPQ
jgi:hypothetical protein